jgi:ABC-2 type transport system ATP-binding protein
VDQVITGLALTRYADRRAGTLSLGNAQRLGLAKALIHRPALLILDEPVNGLDPAGVAEIRGLLASLAREHGVTILLSSHILTEVARLATRIGVIHAGRLIQQFDTADLTSRARPRLRVATRDDAAAVTALRAIGFGAVRDANGLLLDEDRAVHRPDDVATLLVNVGVPPTRLAVEQDDLETYFLRLVNPGADS